MHALGIETASFFAANSSEFEKNEQICIENAAKKDIVKSPPERPNKRNKIFQNKKKET